MLFLFFLFFVFFVVVDFWEGVFYFYSHPASQWREIFKDIVLGTTSFVPIRATGSFAVVVVEFFLQGFLRSLFPYSFRDLM